MKSELSESTDSWEGLLAEVELLLLCWVGEREASRLAGDGAS